MAGHIETDQVSLLHAFPSFALGGSQARFIQLARVLGNKFHHTVMAMDGCYDAAKSIETLSNISYLDIPASRGWNLNNVPRFARALKHTNCDRVVSYNFGSIDWAFASSLLRLPHLHVEDGFSADETDKRLFRRALLRVIALNLSRANVVTVSRGLSEIARREWRIRASRIHYVPNGIDADSILQLSARQRASCFAASDQTVIGTVAGLRPEKRIDRLLRAVASMPPSQGIMLVIAGAGSMRQKLEAQAQSLRIQDRVRFLGHVEPISDLYAEFDIFALASDTEQMPLVVLEAMAAGLPIASTDVGDVRHMLAESNRRWVVPRSANALSAALFEMICNPHKRMSIGADNSACVRQRFTCAGMYAAWERMFLGEPSTGLGSTS